MRSCLSFLLIPLFAFGAFPGRASTTSVAVQSESSARLSYLQGDVRISLGEQEEPEIGKKWIDASAGMPMHAGYSIATEDGTAEIELENGSVIYLAPRSLLMFYELATDDPDGTGTKEFDTVRLKLLTGSVMFLSQFRMDGEFILETQTARLRSDRSVLFRVTSYLNNTEIIDLSQSLPAELLLEGAPSVLPQGKFADGKITVKAPEPDTNDAWDVQVHERFEEREALTLAALRASGLSAAFGGLVDLFENGDFTPCGKNETWEPSKQALAGLGMPASEAPAAAEPQRPVPGQIVSESEAGREARANPYGCTQPFGAMQMGTCTATSVRSALGCEAAHRGTTRRAQPGSFFTPIIVTGWSSNMIIVITTITTTAPCIG